MTSPPRTSQESLNMAAAATSPISPEFDAISLASSAAADAEFTFSSEEMVTELPKSDPNFHRKLFIMPVNSNSGEIHALPHPRSRKQALYMLDKETQPFELLTVEQRGQRSAFCGDAVVADPGPILMFLPVHPLFLALHHLEANAADHFQSAEHFLRDSEFPALQLLARSAKLTDALMLAADCEDGNPTKFRFNRRRLLQWLTVKFHALVESVRANLEDVGEQGPSHVERAAFGIMADYLPDTMGQWLRAELGIALVVVDDGKKTGTATSEDAKTPRRLVGQTGGGSRKRLPDSTDPLGAFISPKSAVVPAAKRRMSRVLAAASKGTQSLKAFFSSSSTTTTLISNKNGDQQKQQTAKEENGAKEEDAVS